VVCIHVIPIHLLAYHNSLVASNDIPILMLTRTVMPWNLNNVFPMCCRPSYPCQQYKYWACCHGNATMCFLQYCCC